MTIQGAIAELQNLLEVDDIPFYYKGGIEKVIETIQMELADRNTEPQTSKIIEAYSRGFKDGAEAVKAIKVKDYVEPYVTIETEPQTIRCPKCGRTDYIRDMEKDTGIKGSCYKYKCINCNTYIKNEQTEDEILREQCRAFIGIVEQTEREGE